MPEDMIGNASKKTSEQMPPGSECCAWDCGCSNYLPVEEVWRLYRLCKGVTKRFRHGHIDVKDTDILHLQMAAGVQEDRRISQEKSTDP